MRLPNLIDLILVSNDTVAGKTACSSVAMLTLRRMTTSAVRQLFNHLRKNLRTADTAALRQQQTYIRRFRPDRLAAIGRQA